MATDPAAQIRAVLTQNVVDGFVAAVHEAGSKGSLQFKALAQALSASAVPESLRIRVHQDIGIAAQAATIEAYESRPERSGVAPYRVGTDPRRTRFADGALLRALRSTGFYSATANGVAIINMDLLDRAARQWRRLNFGAGGGADKPPGHYALELLDASIGLSPDPRPAFALPPGFWIRNGERVAAGEAGTAAFYPRSFAIQESEAGKTGKRVTPVSGLGARGRATGFRMTRGIRATNFLDAGVKEVANTLAPSYLTMYQEFYRSQLGRAHFDAIKVVAPRPRTFNFSGYK